MRKEGEISFLNIERYFPQSEADKIVPLFTCFREDFFNVTQNRGELSLSIVHRKDNVPIPLILGILPKDVESDIIEEDIESNRGQLDFDTLVQSSIQRPSFRIEMDLMKSFGARMAALNLTSSLLGPRYLDCELRFMRRRFLGDTRTHAEFVNEIAHDIYMADEPDVYSAMPPVIPLHTEL